MLTKSVFIAFLLFPSYLFGFHPLNILHHILQYSLPLDIVSTSSFPSPLLSGISLFPRPASRCSTSILLREPHIFRAHSPQGLYIASFSVCPSPSPSPSLYTHTRTPLCVYTNTHTMPPTQYGSSFSKGTPERYFHARVAKSGSRCYREGWCSISKSLCCSQHRVKFLHRAGP